MKQRFFVLIGLLAFCILGAQASEGARLSRKYHNPSPIGLSQSARADSATGFDVQKYTIELSIAQDPNTISGNVLAEVLAEEALPTLSYNLIGLTVSQVLVNGQAAIFTHQNGLVEIQVNKAAGESFSTQVFYSGSPQLSGDGYNIGMYIRPASIFTISDPDAGRYWWPCYDHPWDKAIVDLIITLRSDWKVAANGLRESIVDNGDGTATTTWRGYHPMTTYLACITAANYMEIPQTAMQGELPILNFVTPNQYNNALIDLASLPDIIDYYSQLFGDYPFEKYGNATVNMSTFGAMEHQTMTTLGNYIITGTGAYELVIAHELAHQWFGDAVSFLDFADVWLSEGFATYSEHLWTDKAQGWQAACDYVLTSYHNYYLSWESAANPATIYNPSFYNYFSPPSYEKAASVLHMLRLKLGDDEFFQVLQQYFQTYKHGNAITPEFQAVAEAVSGLDLEQFFAQWIYGKGIPTVDYCIWHHPDTNQLKVSAQSFSPSTTLFDVDLPFLIQHTAGSDSLLVRATSTGYDNLYDDIALPSSHSANHNNWTLLRGLTESRPRLSSCLASSSAVILIWEEYPLATAYQILRRTLGTEDWQILTELTSSITEYIDESPLNGQTYEYIIKAIDSQGFVSLGSEIKSATPVAFSFANPLLVVDETRNGNGAGISPDDAMVDAFYAAALAPLIYTQWDVTSQGLPDLQTLGAYKVVLWHDDDFSMNEIRAAENTLSGYMLGGGQVLISGWKTVSALSPAFFGRFTAGLTSYYDNAPTLISAESACYAQLTVDGDKLAPVWNGMLPYLSSFEGDFETIYTGTVAPGSNAENRSLAFRTNNLVLLGFPLYFMQGQGVREFLQAILPELATVSAADELTPVSTLRLLSYPNPFNPNTTISFELPADGKISLQLYNLKGQKVQELCEGQYKAGQHQISFTSGDLPSGVYILSLNAEGKRLSRRLTLMK
ncbi:MAG: T9SS type A sorting domain-containing protein [Candidatus Cloacimonetes bacterium]|nr:T9SS type A sorting domain-containing protein [Candidatus Cloacimonadota bacterium]MDY0228773.1 M1 family aminopeptidase [Candidatus Cloacimonadaceae bacterium]